MKNGGKVVGNLSKFVKTFMIPQNKGEWPVCLALTSVAEQSSNKSSKQVYLSNYDFVFENKSLTIWDGVCEDNKRFFFSMPEQKVHLKVAES